MARVENNWFVLLGILSILAHLSQGNQADEDPRKWQAPVDENIKQLETFVEQQNVTFTYPEPVWRYPFAWKESSPIFQRFVKYQLEQSAEKGDFTPFLEEYLMRILAGCNEIRSCNIDAILDVMGKALH